MNNNLHSELKKEFQLERMILFSDAVFAIAITLLAIEIKIPEIEKELVSEKTLTEALTHLIPKFVGFLVSFAVIGIYWMVHHRMFGFVVNYSQKLLRLNLIFLFFVAFMPFSTGFYSSYLPLFEKTPVIFYSTNIICLGIMNYLIWRHISNPKNKLSEGVTPLADKLFRLRALTVPAIFVVFAVVYTSLNPRLAAWIPVLIPLIMRRIVKVIEKNYEKKYGHAKA
jgi:uncharacterized membrane protein